MSYTNYMNKLRGKNEKWDLEYLFKNDIKDPFFYNLELNKESDNKTLFENVKNIFFTGLLIHYGNVEEKKVDIDKLSPEKIKTIHDYMLSIGLKLNYKKIDAEERDLLYRRFLYDVENIEGITITIVSNWKTGNINSININIDSEDEITKKELINKIEIITNKHTEANYFLKINPPNKLKDYAIFVNMKEQNETHVISFDYANIGDYAKPLTNIDGPWQG